MEAREQEPQQGSNRDFRTAVTLSGVGLTFTFVNTLIVINSVRSGNVELAAAGLVDASVGAAVSYAGVTALKSEIASN